jgi:hypothetical protein
MTNKNISIGEAYKAGWTSFKSNIGLLISVLAVIIGANILLGIAIGVSGGDKNAIVSLLLNLINFIFGIVISIGLIKIYITLTRGEKAQFSDLFSDYNLFFKFLLSNILNGLIVAGGLMLFIVPGVFWALKFSQYQFLVVDKKKGPIEALKESSKLTAGVKWELLGFIIISILVNMLGMAFFVVGVFLTSIVTKLAFAHVYQQLLDQENSGISEASVAVAPSAPTPVASISNPGPVSAVTPELDIKSEQDSDLDTETKPAN